MSRWTTNVGMLKKQLSEQPAAKKKLSAEELRAQVLHIRRVEAQRVEAERISVSLHTMVETTDLVALQTLANVWRDRFQHSF